MPDSLRRRALLAGAAGWGLAGCTAMPRSPWLSAPAAQLPGTHQMDLRDPASGRTWRVWLQRPPEGPPPPQGYPVLYVLDGNAAFALAAQLARNEAARPEDVRPDPVVVVGIGHPGAAVYHPAARQRDYTPPAAPGGATDEMGGADRLLDFMARELQPGVAANFPVDAARQTLSGHSFGGLFVLHALLTRPQQFTRYAAASPSVWWAEGQILQAAEAFVQHYARPPRRFHATLQLRLGGLERADAATAPRRAAVLRERRMLERTESLAARLGGLQWPELRVQLALLEGLDHGAVMAPALIDALALARQARTPLP